MPLGPVPLRALAVTRLVMPHHRMVLCRRLVMLGGGLAARRTMLRMRGCLDFALQELGAILVPKQLMIAHAVAAADRLLRESRTGAMMAGLMTTFAGSMGCGPMTRMARRLPRLALVMADMRGAAVAGLGSVVVAHVDPAMARSPRRHRRERRRDPRGCLHIRRRSRRHARRALFRGLLRTGLLSGYRGSRSGECNSCTDERKAPNESPHAATIAATVAESIIQSAKFNDVDARPASLRNAVKYSLPS